MVAQRQPFGDPEGALPHQASVDPAVRRPVVHGVGVPGAALFEPDDQVGRGAGVHVDVDVNPAALLGDDEGWQGTAPRAQMELLQRGPRGVGSAGIDVERLQNADDGLVAHVDGSALPIPELGSDAIGIGEFSQVGRSQRHGQTLAVGVIPFERHDKPPQ